MKIEDRIDALEETVRNLNAMCVRKDPLPPKPKSIPIQLHALESISYGGMVTAIVPIPDWANWVAQDECGSWCCYSIKPERRDHGFMDVSYQGSCEMIISGTAVVKSDNWRESLKRV